MSKSFVKMSFADFQELLSTFDFKRTINAVHMHHTWRPRRADFAGESTINAIYTFHTTPPPNGMGWSDIAEHITIDPNGGIWTGRNWNSPPASSTGANGDSRTGPFMFEMIGNFDTGQDPFDGTQRKVVIQVIAAIQRRFQLAPETLRFHRQLDNNKKTCPGSGIDYNSILEEVATQSAMAARAVTDAPFPISAAVNQELVAHALLALLAVPAETVAEEPLDQEMSRSEIRFVSEVSGRAPDDSAARGGLSADDKQKMRPHVITMRMGKYASSLEDMFPTSQEDADAIFTEHLPLAYRTAAAAGRPLRILFYAHGGLVSEQAAFQQVTEQLDFWLVNDIYPIYFIWETGLFEILGQLLQGGAAREITVARRPEWTNEAVAALARHAGGPQIWSAMKRSAELGARDDGASYDVGRMLAGFLKNPPVVNGGAAPAIEVHALGHSAGSIFHANFLPAAFSLGLTKVKSLHLLAPAIRVDDYKRSLFGTIGNGIESATMFTMFKTYELADTCLGIYGHSLLYLIYHGLEDDDSTPILGLEDSLRGDAELKKQFGLSGTSSTSSIVFSRSDSGPRSASQSTSHGGFHNDTATMNSVARRVLNNDVLNKEFVTVIGRGDEIHITLPVSAEPMPSQPSDGGVILPAPAVVTGSSGDRTVKRRALCVGIDNYPTAPLGGCVADAMMWRDKLTQLNFSVESLINGQATEAAFTSAIQRLISTSSAGDVLVIQYSGHGTLLQDPDRPAGDGELEGQDEAVCAYDFADGGFIPDRTVGALFDQLPQGVELTCFFDCCHSGTISRFAVGPGVPVDRVALRARFVRMRPEWYQQYLARRSRTVPPAPRAGGPFRSKQAMRDVVFSACRADEVAYESNGHGHFTLKATALLANSMGQSTNLQFQQDVVAAFGSGAMQHPVLDCTDSRENALLLGGSAALESAGRGVARATMSGTNPAVLALLQAASQLLERQS